jgi:hypothetical protein
MSSKETDADGRPNVQPQKEDKFPIVKTEDAKLDKDEGIVGKELHPNAEKLLRQYINVFATTLLYQAKLLAYQKNDDVVLSNHVEEALGMARKGPERRWLKEVLVILGSTFFGAGVSGIISEYTSAGPRPLLFVIYAVMGFTGIAMMFLGLRQ